MFPILLHLGPLTIRTYGAMVATAFLALDAIWRFPDMPKEYYEDWLKVAKEEAYHFQLLESHLHSLGYRYGSFPAHNSLWEMAEKRILTES